MQAGRSENGFTLIEILVVIIIGSLLLVCVFQQFGLSFKVWQRKSAKMEADYRFACLWKHIDDDLATVYFGDADYDFIGINAQTETGEDGDRLQFVTADGRLPAGHRYDLIRVEYALQPIGENSTLVRTVDTLPFIPAETADSEVAKPGLKNDYDDSDDEMVRSVNFRYYDGYQWLDSWDSRQKGSLPTAVEVSVGIAEPENPDRIHIYTKVVRLLSCGRNEHTGDASQ